MRIDFVSDVVCPWCAIGLASLEEAIRRSGLAVELHVQPFELNPQMGPGGEDIVEHIAAEHGSTAQQIERTHAMIKERGAAVGFTFGAERTRIFNTFDAHRLLHWAGVEGRQMQLKHALLRAYFTEGRDISDYDVLVSAAVDAELDGTRAREVLASGAYASEVRDRERHYRELGITGVPAIIFENKHLITGGQPVEVFEGALRQVASSEQG